MNASTFIALVNALEQSGIEPISVQIENINFIVSNPSELKEIYNEWLKIYFEKLKGK
jgi:hypothetical protein